MGNYASTAEEIISTSLMNYVGQQKTVSQGIMICCPLPDHNDKTPSFGINLSIESGYPLGIGHCLGCGKTLKWNEIADLLGFTKIKQSDLKVTSYKQKQRSHLLMKGGLSLKDIVTREYRCSEFMPKWPSDRDWRGISGRLMNKFAYRAFDPEHAKEYAILPVTIDGELKGAIKAVVKRTDDPNELAYVTSKGFNKNGWVKKFGLFPYDVVQEMLEETKIKTIVLVEGPRDSLNLIQNGIPSLSILGSQAWSPSKMKLLLSLNITKVVLCMDGDLAGKSATEFIFPTLEKKIDVEVYDLYAIAQRKGLKKLDPGQFKGARLERVRSMLV